MRVLIQVDVPNWAIDQLALIKANYSPHHTFKVYYIHPRDAGELENQKKFEEAVKEFKPDVIHFEYFRSCSQLLEALPSLKEYKVILTHHNQRDKALYHRDWNKLGVDCLVTHTDKAARLLTERGQKNVRVIKHGIDLEEFYYSDSEPEAFTVGYVGRIVPWKGLKEIAEACCELKIPVKFMGRPEKTDYFNEISEKARENINFDYKECEDKKRREFYENISCYVGFSKDGYEEGTLGYFEAMASGVPVITTPNGSADDFGKGDENCLMVDFEDRHQLKNAIKEMRDDKDLRRKLRKNGWATVKNYPAERMAYEYSKLYYEIGSDFPLVSVIIPATIDRFDCVYKILDSLKENNYSNFEVVLCWDEAIMTIKNEKQYNFPLKQIVTWKEGYNLAMARNMGAIEAEGDILVFCDSRLQPDKDSLLMFQQAIEHAGEITMGGSKKVWFFGDKGSAKRSFVENFSAVKRKHFVEFGMMNERVFKYGGMSQEIRSRWAKQGGVLTYLPEVKAKEIASSKLTNERRKDIISMKFLLFKLYENSRH